MSALTCPTVSEMQITRVPMAELSQQTSAESSNSATATIDPAHMQAQVPTSTKAASEHAETQVSSDTSVDMEVDSPELSSLAETKAAYNSNITKQTAKYRKRLFRRLDRAQQTYFA